MGSWLSAPLAGRCFSRVSGAPGQAMQRAQSLAQPSTFPQALAGENRNSWSPLCPTVHHCPPFRETALRSSFSPALYHHLRKGERGLLATEPSLHLCISVSPALSGWLTFLSPQDDTHTHTHTQDCQVLLGRGPRCPSGVQPAVYCWQERMRLPTEWPQESKPGIEMAAGLEE